LNPNLPIDKSQHLLAFYLLYLFLWQGSLLMASGRAATEQAALLQQQFMSIASED